MGDVSSRFLVLLIFFISIDVGAAKLVYIDFDNAIVESRRVYKGSFNTSFVLFRINKANTIQSEPKGPEMVLVTMQELKQIYDKLAKSSNSSYIPGSLQKFRLASGPQITVGEYALIPDKSFIYFRESNVEGRNYLLEAFQEAESKDLTSSWKGPMWELMTEMLSDKIKATQFGILTARGHSQKEWKEFFNYLKQKGYIRYLPNLNNIHNLSNPEYDTFGKSMSERKANFISHLALQGLGRTVLTDADISIDRNGGGVEKVHTLIYAGESKEDLEAILEVLEKITTGRYAEKNIKFVIVNTGFAKDVKASKRPRIFVLRKDDGSARRLSEAELQSELSGLSFVYSSKISPKVSNPLSCQELFL